MRNLLLCALALVGVSSSAQAVDWHLGLGAADQLDDRNPAISADGPDAETAITAVAGVEVGQGFGVEASWVDLGEYRVANVADAGYESDGDLWSLGLTWAPDTGALQPYAKLGWFSRSEDGTGQSIAGPVRVDFDDDGLMGEIGGRWFVTESFALRAGYAWYDFEHDADGSVQLLAELHFD